jgi:hypothetical protein
MAYANLFFLIVVSLKINQPIWFSLTPVLIMIVNCALLHKYFRLLMRLVVQDERQQHNMNLLIMWLMMSYFLVMPSILTSDTITFWVIGFLWVPQILKNLMFKP